MSNLPEPTIVQWQRAFKNIPEHHFIAQRLRDDWAMNFKAWENHFELRFLKQWMAVSPPYRILDIGYGMGFSDVLLAAEGYTVIGVENDKYCFAAASYLKSFQLKAIQDRFKLLPPGTIPAPAEDYDVVWMSHVVEHVTDSDLEKLFRLLSGRILISVPLQGGFSDKTDLHTWANRQELVDFLQGRAGQVAWCEEFPESVIRAEVRL